MMRTDPMNPRAPPASRARSAAPVPRAPPAARVAPPPRGAPAAGTGRRAIARPARPARRPEAPAVGTTVCTHYQRRVNLVAPCCGRVVCCHRGHDEARVCRSRLDLKAVAVVVCTTCGQRQPVANACRACSRSFGEHGCTICRMWYAGDGFHCNQCGVCRAGRARDAVHCKACSMCYPLRAGAFAHTCAGAALSGRCPVCGEGMARSRKPAVAMACGHAMHAQCFLQHVKTSFACPVRECRKTVANMRDWNRALDAVAEAELRANPARTVRVYCFDCRATSTVRTAGNLKKCKVPQCGSYNTVRIPPSQQGMPFVLPPANIRRR